MKQTANNDLSEFFSCFLLLTIRICTSSSSSNRLFFPCEKFLDASNFNSQNLFKNSGFYIRLVVCDVLVLVFDVMCVQDFGLTKLQKQKNKRFATSVLFKQQTNERILRNELVMDFFHFFIDSIRPSLL